VAVRYALWLPALPRNLCPLCRGPVTGLPPTALLNPHTPSIRLALCFKGCGGACPGVGGGVADGQPHPRHQQPPQEHTTQQPVRTLSATYSYPSTHTHTLSYLSPSIHLYTRCVRVSVGRDKGLWCCVLYPHVPYCSMAHAPPHPFIHFSQYLTHSCTLCLCVSVCLCVWSRRSDSSNGSKVRAPPLSPPPSSQYTYIYTQTFPIPSLLPLPSPPPPLMPPSLSCRSGPAA
jgi:hypothetical protein